jgi:hypothetical protein
MQTKSILSTFELIRAAG